MIKKVLITGFDPFGGETTNPSYEAIKLLPNVINNVEIIKLEIPTVFNKSITKVAEAMVLHQPDIVINVGQAGGRFDITPERVAINQDDARILDNEGNQPIDSSIASDGEAAYFATLPIKSIVKNIKAANVPASVSNTAGTFVCNHIMYGVLNIIDKTPEFSHIKAGFIHVPFITSQVIDKPNMPSLTLEQIATGLEIAIRTAIEVDTDEKIIGGATH